MNRAFNRVVIFYFYTRREHEVIPGSTIYIHTQDSITIQLSMPPTSDPRMNTHF